MSLSSEVGDNVYLVVDDIASIRHTVTWMLGNMGVKTHLQATNGIAAIDLLSSADNAATCIIADFMMPEMNGLALLKAVRTGAVPVARNLPFVMLTGFDDEHLVGAAMALDVDAFLLKPISKDALEEKLKRVLWDAATEANPVKPVADYEAIDIAAVEAPYAAKAGAEGGVAPGTPRRPLGVLPPADAGQTDSAEAEPGIEVLLDAINSPAELARDVLSDHGQLLLARGQVITPRTVARLKDLKAWVSVKTVWVKAPA